MIIRPIRCGMLSIGALLFIFPVTPALVADDQINYVEALKPIEPLEGKKALELATAFFEKKYPNNPKNYFAQKMEYGQYSNSPHPYSWEITFFSKPGHAISLSDPISVMLLVEPGGKVSVEHEAWVEFPKK